MKLAGCSFLDIMLTYTLDDNRSRYPQCPCVSVFFRHVQRRQGQGSRSHLRPTLPLPCRSARFGTRFVLSPALVPFLFSLSIIITLSYNAETSGHDLALPFCLFSRSSMLCELLSVSFSVSCAAFFHVPTAATMQVAPLPSVSSLIEVFAPSTVPFSASRTGFRYHSLHCERPRTNFCQVYKDQANYPYVTQSIYLIVVMLTINTQNKLKSAK
jgi:hypothetical protein